MSVGLKLGDKIRITGLPGAGVEGYCIPQETAEAYELLVARKRSVRISDVDDNGTPWFQFRQRDAFGQWAYHWMGVFEDDGNWVRVKTRTTATTRSW